MLTKRGGDRKMTLAMEDGLINWVYGMDWLIALVNDAMSKLRKRVSYSLRKPAISN